MPERRTVANRITFWVITFNPSDYPGKYVVREQWAKRGVVVSSDVCSVHDTLAAARGAVPPGCICFTRHPQDDPVIVESWMQ